MWLDGLCDFDVTNMMYHLYGLCRVLCLFINKYGFTYLYCALWVCMHVLSQTSDIVLGRQAG